MTFLDTLRDDPERCSDCGWHPPTQGHRPTCAPVAPADPKAEAYARFKVALVEAADSEGLVSQTRMRPRIANIPHKWRGQFYKRAKDEAVIFLVDKEPSTDVAGGNADKDQKVYRLRSAA